MMFDLHDSVSKADLKGKVVFWDMDGTLAPFRFNGHIRDLEGSRHSVSMKEIQDGIYFERTPSRFMQRVINDCEAKENIIITHCHCDREVEDKHRWLDRNFPMIKVRFVIDENISKTDTILDYCKKSNIPLKNVAFIDDSLHFLKEAESMGIPCWHISSLLDYFE